MAVVTIQIPDSVLPVLRLAAAIKWYELRRVSQEKAAEVAGISRADFITALSLAKVSPFQLTPEEVQEELDGLC